MQCPWHFKFKKCSTHKQYSPIMHIIAFIFSSDGIYWLKIVKFKGKMKKSHKLQGIQTQFNHFLPATTWQTHSTHGYTRRDYIHHDDDIIIHSLLFKKEKGGGGGGGGTQKTFTEFLSLSSKLFTSAYLNLTLNSRLQKMYKDVHSDMMMQMELDMGWGIQQGAFYYPGRVGFCPKT